MPAPGPATEATPTAPRCLRAAPGSPPALRGCHQGQGRMQAHWTRAGGPSRPRPHRPPPRSVLMAQTLPRSARRPRSPRQLRPGPGPRPRCPLLPRQPEPSPADPSVPPPTASPTARATARWHRLWPLEKGRGLSGTCLQVRGHLEDLPRGPRLVTLRSREAAPCPAPTSQLRRVDLDFSQKRTFPWSQQPRRQKLVTAPVPKPQGPSESPAEPS